MSFHDHKDRVAQFILASAYNGLPFGWPVSEKCTNGSY